jgi:hypothetical protein
MVPATNLATVSHVRANAWPETWTMPKSASLAEPSVAKRMLAEAGPRKRRADHALHPNVAAAGPAPAPSGLPSELDPGQ